MPTNHTVRLPFIVLPMMLFWIGVLCAQPAVSLVGPESIELGQVQWGTYRREVSIANTGNRPLVIVAITSREATARIDRDTIAPGDTAVLRMSLDVEPGRLWAVVAVETNDPQCRFVNIRITARAFEPVLVEWLESRGSSYVNEAMQRPVRLTNKTTEPLTLVPDLNDSYCTNGSFALDLRAPITIYPNEETIVMAECVPSRVGPGHCILYLAVRELPIPPIRLDIYYRADERPFHRP
ncbi:MAG: hypothetical protein JST22_04795 [Bacteroidetes bacterium]|nr:hypothetical protein [Bacteroidota bacterium]